MSEALDQKLSALKLGRIRQIYPSWMEQASHENLGDAEVFEQLLTEELLARQENVLRRKMKAAGFPYPATIEQFEFALRPELKRPVILRYFDSSARDLRLLSAVDRAKRVRENASLHRLGHENGPAWASLCALWWPNNWPMPCWLPHRERRWPRPLLR